MLRIDVKKLRYAAEFLASLYAEKALAGRSRRFVGALRELQERLGAANDAHVARALLARLAPGREAEIVIPDVARGPAEAAFGKAAASAGYWLPEG